MQWSLSGADIWDSQVVDLRPHPAGRRWAGSHPSCQPLESGGGSCQLERDEFGEVVVEEVDQEYSYSLDCTALPPIKGKARKARWRAALALALALLASEPRGRWRSSAAWQPGRDGYQCEIQLDNDKHPEL